MQLWYGTAELKLCVELMLPSSLRMKHCQQDSNEVLMTITSTHLASTVTSQNESELMQSKLIYRIPL